MLEKHLIRVCNRFRVLFGCLERDPKQAPRDSSPNKVFPRQSLFELRLDSSLTDWSYGNILPLKLADEAFIFQASLEGLKEHIALFMSLDEELFA